MTSAKELGLSEAEYNDALSLEKLYQLRTHLKDLCTRCGAKGIMYYDLSRLDMLCQGCGVKTRSVQKVSESKLTLEQVRRFESKFPVINTDEEDSDFVSSAICWGIDRRAEPATRMMKQSTPIGMLNSTNFPDVSIAGSKLPAAGPQTRQITSSMDASSVDASSVDISSMDELPGMASLVKRNHRQWHDDKGKKRQAADMSSKHNSTVTQTTRGGKTNGSQMNEPVNIQSRIASSLRVQASPQRRPSDHPYRIGIVTSRNGHDENFSTHSGTGGVVHSRILRGADVAVRNSYTEGDANLYPDRDHLAPISPTQDLKSLPRDGQELYDMLSQLMENQRHLETMIMRLSSSLDKTQQTGGPQQQQQQSTLAEISSSVEHCRLMSSGALSSEAAFMRRHVPESPSPTYTEHMQAYTSNRRPCVTDPHRYYSGGSEELIAPGSGVGTQQPHLSSQLFDDRLLRRRRPNPFLKNPFVP